MIKVLDSLDSFIDYRNDISSKVGFVPTMGNLHFGHLSLVEKSLVENKITVVSIFVNPKQFGEAADLENYPRTFDEDRELLENLNKRYPDKKISIFIPKEEDIYPAGFDQYISIESLKDISEGETRPGHFDGVATVVYRLFNLVKPTNAYFGRKDYQQLLVVKELVRQKNLAVKIHGLPIIREADGLAMSSRNIHLDQEQRKESLSLSKSLLKILFDLQTNGLESANNLIQKMLEDKRYNYLEIREANHFAQAKPSDTDLVIVGNFQLGSTRLLDNVEVTL